MQNVSDIIEVLFAQTRAALCECCPPEFVRLIIAESGFKQLHDMILEDAITFEQKDPASNNNVLLIIQTYSSFKAVLHYRLANFVAQVGSNNLSNIYASMISNRGKILSGADIHFKSQIGRRFVLDHGYGTVIGETSIIGNDCYLLGGVTLGAKGIANNRIGRRHPQIGNFVQIGANSCVFGDINIGDYVFIGPCCVICEDVAPNSKIFVKTINQVEKNHHAV